jgi:hypothetical protein
MGGGPSLVRLPLQVQVQPGMFVVVMPVAAGSLGQLLLVHAHFFNAALNALLCSFHCCQP